MAEGGWQIETCDGGDTAASVTLLERLSAPGQRTQTNVFAQCWSIQSRHPH